jgi:LDH2 family malate/lactate/ureidoglycolate dehydrogenase
VEPDEVEPYLRGLGFADDDATALADHFLDAERRGKRGHGLARVEWLATLPGLDPTARPRRVSASPGFQLWDGNGRSAT